MPQYFSMKALTPTQQRVYDWIVWYFSQHGDAPTIREIQKGMQKKSTAPIQYSLDKLEEQGLIIRNGHRRSRNIRLVYPPGVPIMGVIAAGGMVESFSDLEVERIPFQLFSALGRSHSEVSKYFACRVRGDSMIDAAILDGDVVVLRPPIRPIKEGAIVAAHSGGKTTLKHYYRLDKHTIRLQPANPLYDAIDLPMRDVEIQGVYAAVLRGLI